MTTTDLIARLEAATGAEDAGWHDDMCRLIHEVDPHRPVNGICRNYTRSIDAALTLVPDGWQHGYATIPSDDILRAKTHHAQAYVDGSKMQDFTKYFRAEAATPALALCIASLRAREHG